MTAPANPTRNYNPSVMGIGGGAMSYLLDGRPWFSYYEVPRINRDPWVSFLKKIWISPLRQLRWTVKATSQPVADYVDRAYKRFWAKGVPGIMRRYFDWGFAPGGVEYREKRGRWLLDLVRPIHSFDARVLVHLRGPKAGEVAGFSTDSTGPVLGPYAFWFAGHGEHGRFYDRPPIANLYDPWLAKNERGGMLQLQYLLSRKHAVRPAVGKHPAGEQTWQEPGGEVRTISNQKLMLSALEIYEAGGNIALENGTDEHGNPLWDITPAEAGPDVKQIADAVDALDIKMGEAVGLPAEVVRAAASGSGFSGRSIPNRAWLGGVDEYAGLLIDAFDRSPLRGMVHRNFGPRADYEVEPISLVQDDQQQGQPGQPPAGPTPPPTGPQTVPPELTGDKPDGDPQGDPFELSAYAAQGQQDKKTDANRQRNATRFVMLAILRLQERAHAEGDPHKYDEAIRRAAELAGNPDDVRAILDGEADGDRFEMAWQPYLSKRKTKGGDKGIQIGWFDDANPDRIVYGTKKPGERRAKAQADAGTADALLDKIASGTPEEQAGHLRALADHLPALTVAKLREVRGKLNGAFGGRRAKADGMVEALAEHFRLRAATAERHNDPDMVEHRAKVAEAADLKAAKALPATASARTGLEGAAVGADVGDDLRPDALSIQRPTPEPAPSPPTPPAARPDGTPTTTSIEDVYTVPTGSLKTDPARFQYKVSGIGKAGVGKELKSVGKWNPALGGVLLVWRDPADGQDYVVNGHHRHELAERVGADKVNVRYVQSANATQARAVGALANIAEGRGTAVDAAKYLRDTGLTPEQMADSGVSLSGKVAADAAALRTLSDKTFQAVTNGTLEESTAVAVAKHLPDPKLQDQLFKHIATREADGKEWTAGQIETAAKKMANAGTTTVAGKDLFGDFEDEHSTFDQEVELEHHIGRQLSQEANDFGAGASQRRADRLAGAGNTLNVGENARLRDEAVSNAELFDRHRHLKGPVAEALKASAAKLAQAKTKKEKDRVKSEAVESARAALARIGTPDEPEPVLAVAGGPGSGDRTGAAGDPTPGRSGEPDHAGAAASSAAEVAAPAAPAEALPPAGADAATSAPAPSAPPAVGSPEWESRMAAGYDPRDHANERDDEPPVRAADAHDKEAEAAAEERAGRMEGWAADRPNSEAARMHADAARQAVEDAREVAGKPRPTAAGGRPPAEWEAGVPAGASGETRAAHERFVGPIHANDKLAPEQKAKYATAMGRVLGQVPAAVHQQLAAGLPGGAHFYPNSDAIQDGILRTVLSNPALSAEDIRQATEEVRESKAKGEKVAGVFNTADGSVHLDGGNPGDLPGRHGEGAGTEHETYAHELGHVLDRDGRHTNTPEWAAAHAAEIATPDADGEHPLTAYAATSLQEGFAEFARLLYSGAWDTDDVAKTFPQASAYMKSQGLWPATGGDREVSSFPERFDADARIDLGAAGHADVMLKKGRPAPVSDAERLQPAVDELAKAGPMTDRQVRDWADEHYDRLGSHMEGRKEFADALIAARKEDGVTTQAPPPAPATGQPAPDPQFDAVTKNATARHETDLEAMKPNTQKYVGGYLVTRQMNGAYHIDHGKKSVSHGDAAKIAQVIRDGHGRQKWQAGRVAAALKRASAHTDAIPMIEQDRYDHEQRRADAIPDGAAAVSTAEGTYGRVGTLKRGDDGGRRLAFDDSPDEHYSLDYEPLEPEHSWRGPEAAMRRPRPVAAARKGLFDDVGKGEPAPSPAPAGAVASAPMTPPAPEPTPAPQPDAVPLAQASTPDAPPWVPPPVRRKYTLGTDVDRNDAIPMPSDADVRAQYDYAKRTGDWPAFLRMDAAHENAPGGFLLGSQLQKIAAAEFGPEEGKKVMRMPKSKQLAYLLEKNGYKPAG